jgi:hypothetical protein
MNVPQWKPAFVVDSRQGNVSAYQDLIAQNGWVYGNAGVFNGNIKLVSNSAFTMNGAEFIISGGSTMHFGNDGSPRIYAQHIYDRTYGSGANMYITSSYTLGRSTSATKYKEDIQHDVSVDYAKRLLTLTPATWHDKSADEQLAKAHETGDWSGDIPFFQRYYGLIAEDVEAAGLGEFCEYDKEHKEIEGIDYSKMWVLIIPIINDMQKNFTDKLYLMQNEIEILKASRDNALVEIAKLQREVA